MKVYVNSSSEGLRKGRLALGAIIKGIDYAKHELSSDWIRKVLTDPKINGTKKSEQSPSQIFRENISALTKADACIFEISSVSWGVAYQVAYSTSKEVPTLCLYSEEDHPRYLSHMLVGMRSKYLELKSYTESSLTQIIRDFLKRVEELQLVKFNFIANKEIKKYVEWAAKQSGNSKSEFLRDMITKVIIAKDDKYKKTIL